MLPTTFNAIYQKNFPIHYDEHCSSRYESDKNQGYTIGRVNAFPVFALLKQGKQKTDKLQGNLSFAFTARRTVVKSGSADYFFFL